METKTFELQITRLKSHFGSDLMTTERLKLIWVEIRDLPDQTAVRLIDFLIGEFTRAYTPTVSKIREEAERLRKWHREQDVKLANQNLKVSDLDRHNTGNFDLQKHISENSAEYANNSLVQAILKRKPALKAETKSASDQIRELNLQLAQKKQS